MDFDPNRLQEFKRVFDPIILIIVNGFYISKVDESFRALNTWKMSDKNDLLDLTRCIAIDDGVFFRVKAAAISGFFSIAAVMKSGRIPVISHCEYFAEVCASNHCSYFESMASGSSCQSMGKLKIDFFEAGAFFFNFGLGHFGYYFLKCCRERLWEYL